jgi:hypothetical protein
MTPEAADQLQRLSGQVVSRVWRGHGSALFLEFGRLSPVEVRGRPDALEGEMTLMIEWSWRIEAPDRILGGSWSEEADWPGLFEGLAGARVAEASLFGRLPEIAVRFDDGRSVCSFMTADGQPAWTLFDRSAEPTRWIEVEGGRVVVGAD